MASKEKGASLSDASGGDGGRELYEELTDDLLYDPAIGRATMMGYPCVRLAGRFLASYDEKEDCLVVKLPRERVQEVIEAGDGAPFDVGDVGEARLLERPGADRRHRGTRGRPSHRGGRATRRAPGVCLWPRRRGAMPALPRVPPVHCLGLRT